MSDLKPCPFCANTDIRFYDRNWGRGIGIKGAYAGILVCTNCQCRTGIGEKQEVIDAWNNRPSVPRETGESDE
jgi:hypothetical protein